MNVYDIISEDKIINEAPTSGIGNAVKGLVGKLPGGERMAGSAEMGKEANELYKVLKKWQGINGKNDKTMTDQDFAAFMQQNSLSAGGMTLPQGVLDKKTVMDVLKQAAKNKLTGGNSAAAPKPAGTDRIEPTMNTQDSLMNKAIKSQGGKTGNTKASKASKASTAGKPQATTPKGVKKGPTGKPIKIDPKLQAKIDTLSDKHKKALAGML